MNRKTFLSRLGGAGLTAMIPLTPMMAIGRTDGLTMNNTNGKVIRESEGKVLEILGNIQKHKIIGKENNNQIFEWVDHLKPGSGIPPHIHTKEDEIFRVIKGQVEIMVDNKATVLKSGDMAYAPKHMVHSWRVIGDEAAEMCVSAFPAGMEHMFEELNELPAGPPDFAQLGQICSKYGIRFV
ncbi:MAG: cupin domain-containing protein [Eudoraea sp.]|nr:cupin domain-containing protein [Eudoraea sp.]